MRTGPLIRLAALSIGAVLILGAAPAKTGARKATALAAEGRAALAAGNHEAAALLLREAYEADARSEFLLDLARVHEKLRDRGRVIFYYRAYLAASAADAPGRKEATEALRRLGVADHDPMAATVVPTVESSARLGDRLLSAFYATGLLTAAQWERVAAAYRLAAELDPGNPTWPAKEAFADAGRTFALYAEARAEGEKVPPLSDILERTLSRLDVARLLKPKWSHASYLRCYVLVEAESRLDAMAACRDAHSEDPKWALPLVSIGYLLRSRGDFVAGAEMFALAASHASTWAWPRYQLCFTLVRLTRYEDAARQCSEAVRLDPGLSDAYLSLGFAHHKLGRTADAMLAYKRAILADPFSKHALRNACFLLVENGEYEEGALVCRRGLAPAEEDAVMMEALGDAYFGLGKWTDARRAYRDALTTDRRGERIDVAHCKRRLERLERELDL